MARGGLGKWFNENWVDIGRPKKGGGYHKCGRRKAKKGHKGYPKCVPAAKAARMTKAQIRSAVRRKRSKAQGVGGKPTFVKTMAKRGRKKATRRREIDMALTAKQKKLPKALQKAILAKQKKNGKKKGMKKKKRARKKG